MSAMTADLEPKYIRIKNWQRYQHYRAQFAPPWIKLHRSLLRDQEFMALPELTQWRLVKSWLAASEAGGVLPNNPKLLMDLLRIRGGHVTRLCRTCVRLVTILSGSGFWILSDTKENSREALELLYLREEREEGEEEKKESNKERRREEEEEREEKFPCSSSDMKRLSSEEHCAFLPSLEFLSASDTIQRQAPDGVVNQAKKPPAANDPSYTLFFEAFWDNYPKTNGSKHEAFKAWRQVGLESAPKTLELAMRRLSEYCLCPQWKIGYVPHAATWLRQRRWETEPDTTERGGKRGKTIPEQNQEVLDRLLADPTV
jgi:hypothetical protein